jgi:hypothetical protein
VGQDWQVGLRRIFLTSSKTEIGIENKEVFGKTF